MASTPKPPEVTVEPRPDRKIKEDVSVKEIPGASPDAVYAELEAAARNAAAAPPQLAPVEVQPPASAPESATVAPDTLRAHGGVVSEDGETISFGEKVFFNDPQRRRSVERKVNLAAGPRIVKMPEPGVFLPATKSFRSVPYRTPQGDIRIDH